MLLYICAFTSSLPGSISVPLLAPLAQEPYQFCLRSNWHKGKHVCVCVCVRACERVYACAQLCPTLCEPLDCPGSSVYKIFRARILESVVISYSRVSPTQGLNPHILHLLHWQADSLPLRHLGSLAQSKTCVHVQKHGCQPQERIKYFLLRLTLGERSVNE